MITSPRRAIQYPSSDRSDRPDAAIHIGTVAQAVDVDVLYTQGTNASRLAATHQGGGGRFWYETDTQNLYYDDGTNWHNLGTPLAGSIVASMLAPNCVASSNIIDGTIQTVDIANGAITSPLIADGTIQTVDIADGAITSAKLAPGAGTSYGSAAFPTTGLTTGYRYTMFIPDLDGSGNSIGFDFVYRPDMDAANPWVCVGSGRLSNYNLGSKSIINGSTPAFTSFNLPTHPGIWDMEFGFGSLIGSQSNAVPSSVSVAGGGTLGTLFSIGTNNTGDAGGFIYLIPPIRKTIAGGETISGTFTHTSAYGETGYVNAQWFAMRPIRLAS